VGNPRSGTELPRELSSAGPDVWTTRALARARLEADRVRDAWRQLRVRRRELESWGAAVRFLMAH
jgi:hypothetical protein